MDKATNLFMGMDGMLRSGSQIPPGHVAPPLSSRIVKPFLNHVTGDFLIAIKVYYSHESLAELYVPFTVFESLKVFW